MERFKCSLNLFIQLIRFLGLEITGNFKYRKLIIAYGIFLLISHIFVNQLYFFSITYTKLIEDRQVNMTSANRYNNGIDRTSFSIYSTGIFVIFFSFTLTDKWPSVWHSLIIIEKKLPHLGDDFYSRTRKAVKTFVTVGMTAYFLVNKF